MQLTGAITRGFKSNYPSITFYSPFHPPTHTLFLASVETLVVGLSPAEKQGPSPRCLLVRSRVKPSSRFGLFPGRTGTSCRRRFLKEHTSSLSLSICAHAKNKNKTQNMHCHMLKPVSQRAHYFPLSSRLRSVILLARCCMSLFFSLCTSVFCPLLVCLFLLMAPHLVFVGC